VPGLYGYLQLQRLDGTVVYEGDSNDTGVNPFDRLPAGSGTACITIPARILGAGTYQIYLSFASGFDPAGPEIDGPGVVGEFRLDDTSTRRGNRRNGFLSLKLPWQMVEQQQ
jgi:lipopolysaccharide transport system ATP-binding protein